MEQIMEGSDAGILQSLPHFPYFSQDLQITPPCDTQDRQPQQQQHFSVFDCAAEPSSIDWASLLQPRPPEAAAAAAAEETNTARVIREGDVGGGTGTREQGIFKSSPAGRTKKAVMSRPSRFAFHTRSSNDVLDDGYRWRKYGQKAVKNSMYPRSYYRCTHHTCKVKKQVQRLSEDTSIVVTTYEGVHNHPCEKLMEALAPLLKQVQFLAPLLGQLF